MVGTTKQVVESIKPRTIWVQHRWMDGWTEMSTARWTRANPLNYCWGRTQDPPIGSFQMYELKMLVEWSFSDLSPPPFLWIRMCRKSGNCTHVMGYAQRKSDKYRNQREGFGIIFSVPLVVSFLNISAYVWMKIAFSCLEWWMQSGKKQHLESEIPLTLSVVWIMSPHEPTLKLESFGQFTKFQAKITPSVNVLESLIDGKELKNL